MALRRTTAPVAVVAILLGGVLGAALAGCGAEPPTEGLSVVQGFERLEAPAFAERMDDPGTVVLDVRSAEDYAAGHLPGAVHLDLADDAAVAALDADVEYALYCNDGTVSFPAMRTLAARGVDQVFDLRGGTRAWQDYGGTLTPR